MSFVEHATGVNFCHGLLIVYYIFLLISDLQLLKLLFIWLKWYLCFLYKHNFFKKFRLKFLDYDENLGFISNVEFQLTTWIVLHVK